MSQVRFDARSAIAAQLSAGQQPIAKRLLKRADAATQDVA